MSGFVKNAHKNKTYRRVRQLTGIRLVAAGPDGTSIVCYKLSRLAADWHSAFCLARTAHLFSMAAAAAAAAAFVPLPPARVGFSSAVFVRNGLYKLTTHSPFLLAGPSEPPAFRVLWILALATLQPEMLAVIYASKFNERAPRNALALMLRGELADFNTFCADTMRTLLVDGAWVAPKHAEVLFHEPAPGYVNDALTSAEAEMARFAEATGAVAGVTPMSMWAVDAGGPSAAARRANSRLVAPLWFADYATARDDAPGFERGDDELFLADTYGANRAELGADKEAGAPDRVGLLAAALSAHTAARSGSAAFDLDAVAEPFNAAPALATRPNHYRREIVWRVFCDRRVSHPGESHAATFLYVLRTVLELAQPAYDRETRKSGWLFPRLPMFSEAELAELDVRTRRLDQTLLAVIGSTVEQANVFTALCRRPSTTMVDRHSRLIALSIILYHGQGRTNVREGNHVVKVALAAIAPPSKKRANREDDQRLADDQARRTFAAYLEVLRRRYYGALPAPTVPLPRDTVAVLPPPQRKAPPTGPRAPKVSKKPKAPKEPSEPRKRARGKRAPVATSDDDRDLAPRASSAAAAAASSSSSSSSSRGARAIADEEELDVGGGAAALESPGYKALASLDVGGWDSDIDDEDAIRYGGGDAPLPSDEQSLLERYQSAVRPPVPPPPMPAEAAPPAASSGVNLAPPLRTTEFLTPRPDSPVYGGRNENGDDEMLSILTPEVKPPTPMVVSPAVAPPPPSSAAKQPSASFSFRRPVVDEFEANYDSSAPASPVAPPPLETPFR